MKIILTIILLAISMYASADEPKNWALMKPTPEMIEEAKNNPGGWVYVIEGNFGPSDAVPPEAIKGAWKVDEKGKLTGEYKANPNYKGK